MKANTLAATALAGIFAFTMLGFNLGEYLAPKIVLSSTTTKSIYYNDNGMPKIIYIDGDLWYIIESSIKDDKSAIGADGYTDCSNRNIWIRPNLPIHLVRQDIVHELMHAGACDKPSDWWNNKAANSANQIDHEGIYHTGLFLSQVLHDNPELTKFIAGN
jgi:hypothetical protein